METIEERLNKIEERNRKVELDKAWETSLMRIIFVSLITYIAAFFVIYSMGVSRPYLNALIPVLGFILSTQSIPVIKRYWIKNK
jgi:preprotein translocase subunit SecF